MVAWDRDGDLDDVNNYACVDCDGIRPADPSDVDAAAVFHD